MGEGTHRAVARPARGPIERPPGVEGDDVAVYLTDASRFPGGHAPRAWLPTSEGQVAWVVRHEARVLPVGAQSSLTGGATPRGEAVVSFARMARVLELAPGRARVEAGLALVTLEEALRARGAWFPPAPTYTGASVGGVVSTNAAGAATWKYGTTRPWVLGLTVVLATGDVLDLRRGEVTASPDGRFEVALPDGRVLDVPVPRVAAPAVPKCSAGYVGGPGLDLVDLFVGAEGTLGLVTEVELRVLEDPPQLLVALVPVPDDAAALELTAALRDASRASWAATARGAPPGLDVRAIESLDARCLALLREDGKDREHGVDLPPGAGGAVLVQVELPPDLDAGAAFEAFAACPPVGGAGGEDGVTRLLALLAARDLLDGVEVALPGDRPRAAQLFAVREAVPVAVNHRVEARKRAVDPGIHKVGGDVIVPFERLGEALAGWRAAFARRGLDLAVWGHISDGNLHPNGLPATLDDVARAKEALLECGELAIALGGCPLAEHGTGRNPVKQALLRRLHGDEGVASMRRTRAALDPAGKLAPGVLFPAAPPAGSTAATSAAEVPAAAKEDGP